MNEMKIMKPKKKSQLILGALAATLLTGVSFAQLAPSDILSGAGHLRLVNPLDRPEDGYCIDLVGSGPYIRFDMPLTTHNCKPGLYHDEAVIIDDGTHIRFPTYGACVTAAGLNGRALAGAALIPRACGESSPFLEAEKLQRFTFHPNGTVELEGSGLCMTAGKTSASTFEDTHRWRSLYLEECADVEADRARWEFRIPDSR